MNEVLSQKENEYDYIIMDPTINNLLNYFNNHYNNDYMFYVIKRGGTFDFEDVDSFNTGNLIETILNEKSGSPNKFILIKQKD